LGDNHLLTAAGFNKLAQLYAWQGKYEQAEPLYRRALEISMRQIDPHHPETQKIQSAVRALPLRDKEGCMKKKRSWFQRIFSSKGQSPRPDHASPPPEGLREQLLLNPEASPIFHFHWTDNEAARYLEQNSASMENFIQSIQLDPTRPGTYIMKADALAAMKRFEEALQVYEEAIRIEPLERAAAGLYLRKGGILAHDLGRLPEALEALDQAIQLDPTNDEPWIQKASVWYQQDKYQEALDALDQAIQRRPRYFLAYLNKGAILDKLGRYEDALLACEQAIQREPNFGGTHRLKREILTKLGR
jgi:tetratricopeptide (TPR) repeat protein